MQREIKFRAWLRDLKQMAVCISQIQSDSNGVFEITVPFGKEDGAFDLIHFRSDEYELMQFIGLKDKYGIDIYEGDIVKLNSWDGVQQVTFLKGVFCLADAKGEFVADIHNILQDNRPQASVIGNIYENSALLNA
jgi:uncharacterized phage protein (TIGR01671 family)